MTNTIRVCAIALSIGVCPLALNAQGAKQLPLKFVGPPTTPDITAGDLMTRLYIFADDSMMGRKIGQPGNLKGTAYIEGEVRRLGLKPAGDSGGYFQYLPVVWRRFDTTSVISVGNVNFKGNADFIGRGEGIPVQMSGLPIVYGGMQYDTLNILPASAARDKIVVLTPFIPGPGFNSDALVSSHGFSAYQEFEHAAAGLIFVFGPAIPPVAFHQAPSLVRELGPKIQSLTVTTRIGEAIFGGPLAGITKGTAGKPIGADVRFIDSAGVARNVVAILPGSDPNRAGEYVAIGGHNDHIGYRTTGPADHDSVRAFDEIVRPEGADSPGRAATPEEVTRIRALTDSLRQAHGGPRPDSIYNGADDDGTGSVSVLEIAEAFAKGTVKPKRSIVFVWHVGEEAGLWGSEYFTDHPTVPRESIVAQLNMDMVGRGAATDVTGRTKDGKDIHGGPGYLQLVGSRRLSTELGDIVESVNKDKKLGFNFDYSMDANNHPEQIYCRSDHYSYARYGIPIVFFTTGGHADYHQITDEPQYIDYDRMAAVDKLVFETALRVANLGHPVKVDKPKPDPKGECKQ